MNRFFFHCCFLCIIAGCGSKGQNAATSDKTDDTQASREITYDLSRPAATAPLPSELKEVSGNAWVDDSDLLMIEDLHPDLYLVHTGKEGMIEKTIPFAADEDKKFDIEDVAVNDSVAYALWSHGVVYRIGNWKSKPVVQQWQTDLSKKNNTEGLCFDPVSHNLLIACKNKSGDEEEKKSTRAVYMFDLGSGQVKDHPFLLIRKKDFEKIGQNVDGFYPSAIAVHPVTHDIYLLSTRETKGMAVYSYDGKMKSFQPIDKDLMPQPEGMCFSANGDLYITTEGKHGEPAKVLRFGKR